MHKIRQQMLIQLFKNQLQFPSTIVGILSAVRILSHFFGNQYIVKALLIASLMTTIIYCLPRGKKLSEDH